MDIKEQAKLNLLDFKKVMDNLKIPFCLQAGTLLGAYRDKDFVKGDESDIDVAILEDDYIHINEIAKELIKNGFMKGFEFRPFYNKIECIKFAIGENHLDVFSMHVREKGAFNIGRSFNNHGLPPFFVYNFPSECFKNFEKLNFLGESFNVPSPPEMYLNAKYINWKIPIPRERYDYLDIKQAPCIAQNDWWLKSWDDNIERYPE